MSAGTLQITPRRTKLHRLFAYRFALLAGPGTLFIMIALLLPLLSIVVFSFWRTESYELYADWNLDNYRVMLTEPAYRVFFLRSFFMALSVTLGCLVIAWPVAYFIAKHGGRYRLLLVLLLAAPFFTGVILRIAALQGLFGPIGLINMTLTEIGLPPIQVLMYTPLAAGIGLVYLYVPFMITAIYLSVINFNFELLEVAKINGAKPWRAFIEITWPLNWIGTAIGLVVVFIPCLASVVTQRFLGGTQSSSFGMSLAQQFGETGTWALGSAMGVALFVFSIAAIILIGRSINLKRSGFTGVINP
ncbi:ABC transporter permease [Hypericibacter sp.]|uniref:ABC transporter permease n=1 Tax=Hypericibacter sp. TaxID=2705401 RepID=UPI003D6C9AE8